MVSEVWERDRPGCSYVGAGLAVAARRAALHRYRGSFKSQQKECGERRGYNEDVVP